MRKGITPIIAIIVLLLITIALAGTAWTFLNQYMTSTTGKNFQLIDSFCISGTTAKVILKNVGTGNVNVGTCSTMSGDTTTCGDVIITRTDGGDLSGASLDKTGSIRPQETVTFTDTGCTTGGTSNVCNYRFALGSLGTLTASVSCFG